MIVSPPELPTAAPYPIWDPMPRPPRRTASWIALALVGVAGIVAAVGVDRFLGARYAVRADVCSTVDLSPVGSALGQPNLTAVAANNPDAEELASGRTELRCQFTLTQPDGAPRSAGTVTATWYDHAVVGQIYYEMQREQATGTGLDRRGTVTDVNGLGDLAFTYHDDTATPVGFRVATLDSNLILDLQVAVTPADPEWKAGQPDPAFAALTETLRASLPRLE